MKYSIQKLLVDLGFKKTHNKPSTNTGIGQYADLMWQNVSNPNVCVYDAQMWVAKHKKEVEKFNQK